MEKSLKLTPTEVVKKKFTKDVKGYNPDEVDEFLDVIVEDYLAFKEFNDQTSEYISKLETAIAELKAGNDELVRINGSYFEKIRTLETDNASMHARLDGIKPSDHVTSENHDMLIKINAYESFLLSHGYNLQEILRKK